MRTFARFTAALLLIGAALAPGRALADDPLEGLAALPPVGVAVVQDGLDGRGRWAQTVRLTIEPGGSLADASLVAYGDEAHVDALFALARRKDPRLPSPALIPAGLTIDVPIDPSTTYILEAVRKTPESTVWRYTNGVVATAYAKPVGGVAREVAFPAGKRTDRFTYPGSNGPVAVRPGGKLVDLTYAEGESYVDVLNQIFGLVNYNAVADFARQTGWSPWSWPPPPDARKEIVVLPRAAYEQEPATVQPLSDGNPVGQRRQAALLEQRRATGIYPVRLESFGTVYHVAVGDPRVTAAQVATLIYGTPSRAVEIAKAAGLENVTPGTAPGANLFGRAFDLSVDYLDERFILSREVDADGTTTIGLVDGARITDYPPARSGPIRVVRYPTGYRRIYYRPPRTLLLLAQGLALFHVVGAPWLAPADATAVAGQYAARIVWTWGPGLPRSPSDLEASMELRTAPGNLTYLEALVAPGPPPTPVGSILDSEIFRDPFVAAGLLLVVACAVVVVVDLARRSSRIFTRPRW